MIRTLIVLLALAWGSIALAAAPSTPTPPPGYEIQLHSPDSWARYYTRIGLGTVLRLADYPQYGEEVEHHCQFLTSATHRAWFALGLSKERGYRLCYETGPFTDREARTMCERLVMRVKANTSDAVQCEVDPANPPPPQEELDRQYNNLTWAALPHGSDG